MVEHSLGKGVVDSSILSGSTVDTTSLLEKLLFQITSAFAEFERKMIAQRVAVGIKRARANGLKFGRPKIDEKVEERIRKALAKGDKGILKIASEFEVGSGTVQRIKAEMTAANV